jgi:hypothetical protein
VTDATRVRTSTELRWVLRPDRSGSGAPELLEHAGKEVYAVGVSKVPGHVEVTLADGSHVRARRDEIVAV